VGRWKPPRNVLRVSSIWVYTGGIQPCSTALDDHVNLRTPRPSRQTSKATPTGGFVSRVVTRKSRNCFWMTF
jgi:hypothetical protein